MSVLLTMADVADVLGVSTPDGLSPAAPLAGVSIDSRSLVPGQLFVALDGRRQSGSMFVRDAMAAGAVAAICDVDAGLPRVFQVADALAAVQGLAAEVRLRSSAVWVAVTGSVGKTTTRQLMAAILSQVGPTVQSPGNYNNALGVPLSILQADARTRFGVIEVGTSAPGEIRELGSLLDPDLGVVTATAEAHLEGLGSMEGVVREKLSLLDTVRGPRAGNVLGLVTDSVPAVAEQLGIRVNVSASGRVRNISAVGTTVEFAGRIVRTPLIGSHLASLVPLAVRAAETAAGQTFDSASIEAALENVRLPPGRCDVRRVRGLTVIDDTYNASPASVEAAAALVAALPCKGRRIAVLGDMLDLGPAAEALHHRVGEAICPQLDVLHTVGELAEKWHPQAIAWSNCDELASQIRASVGTGDVVLVKGSRAMRMERIVNALVAE